MVSYAYLRTTITLTDDAHDPPPELNEVNSAAVGERGVPMGRG